MLFIKHNNGADKVIDEDMLDNKYIKDVIMHIRTMQTNYIRWLK